MVAAPCTSMFMSRSAPRTELLANLLFKRAIEMIMDARPFVEFPAVNHRLKFTGREKQIIPALDLAFPGLAGGGCDYPLQGFGKFFQ